jgi:hypothetical protein
LNTDVLGGGTCVFTPGFNLSKYIKPFIISGNLWYSMPTSYTNEDGKRYPGHSVTFNPAAEYPITKKWIAILELTSYWDCGRLFNPKVNVPREFLESSVPGIEYMATDNSSLALGLNVDMVETNTDSAIRPLLSMIYAF